VQPEDTEADAKVMGPSPSSGSPFPRELPVLIDQPRFSFIKRRDDGRIDFISPLPCPFNYGSVPGTLAADGDREDALVLGARLSRGTQQTWPVLARVHFIDAGVYDAKWVCGRALTTGDRRQLLIFFELYARAKRQLNRARGAAGPTRFDGLELARELESQDLARELDSQDLAREHARKARAEPGA